MMNDLLNPDPKPSTGAALPILKKTRFNVPAVEFAVAVTVIGDPTTYGGGEKLKVR